VYFVAAGQGIRLDGGRVALAAALLLTIPFAFGSIGQFRLGVTPGIAVVALSLVAVFSYFVQQFVPLFGLPDWVANLSLYTLYGTPMSGEIKMGRRRGSRRIGAVATAASLAALRTARCRCLARPARTCPSRRRRRSSSRRSDRAKWQYEPKWDGFRGVLENDNGELALWSRTTDARYCATSPSCVPSATLLPPHSALDGEIVIERDGHLDFDAMQNGCIPRSPRVRKLAAETPATFIAFDVLLWNGEPVHEEAAGGTPQEAAGGGEGFTVSLITTRSRPRSTGSSGSS